MLNSKKKKKLQITSTPAPSVFKKLNSSRKQNNQLLKLYPWPLSTGKEIKQNTAFWKKNTTRLKALNTKGYNSYKCQENRCYTNREAAAEELLLGWRIECPVAAPIRAEEEQTMQVARLLTPWERKEVRSPRRPLFSYSCNTSTEFGQYCHKLMTLCWQHRS